MFDNSPSRLTAPAQPFSHFISADAVASAELLASAAPYLT
jgi:hypothetical protein